MRGVPGHQEETKVLSGLEDCGGGRRSTDVCVGDRRAIIAHARWRAPDAKRLTVYTDAASTYHAGRGRARDSAPVANPPQDQSRVYKSFYELYGTRTHRVVAATFGGART